MPYFERSRNVNVDHSNLYDVQGDATFIFGGPLNESERLFFKRHMAGLVRTPDLDRLMQQVQAHALSHSVRDLPRAKAAYNDYASQDRRRVACFEGTREALLEEIGGWAVTDGDESRIYILSGLAGIGKSTVAQTVAERADRVGLLGGSFFFARDKTGRRNVDKFVSTIAYQLCVYDAEFAQAIGNVLLTDRGSAVTSKDPEEQLKVLIVEPLRHLVHSHSRPVILVIDALDVCAEQDGTTVLVVLNRLVQELPCFKVVLTTRPHPLLHYIDLDSHRVFHLQHIEDKVVDNDIRLYLTHSLSRDRVTRRLPSVQGQWFAEEEDIESLVRASGRLFIIASTAVLFILDKVICDPASQMRRLQAAFTENLSSIGILNDTYAVILRSAVPSGSARHVVERYQAVIGTIVLIQDPLPMNALARLIGFSSVQELRAVIDILEPVLLLARSKEVPQVYHASFSDYITDERQCKDPDLCVVPKDQHTRIATRCFKVMNEQLKQNLLDLREPVCFMENDDALVAEGISEDKFHEKLSSELQYACKYFSRHLEGAHCDYPDLLQEAEIFAGKHLLHWFEVLSWAGRLDLAHRALMVLLKHMCSISPEIRTILSDGLRFISKFYEIVRRSALHTYYSAFTFTPTGSLLYERYAEDATYKLCRVIIQVPTPSDLRKRLLQTISSLNKRVGHCIEAVPTQWGHLISIGLGHSNGVHRIAFSQDSSTVVTWADESSRVGKWDTGRDSELRVWDAKSGTPIRTFKGDTATIAGDFSTVALALGGVITLYKVEDSIPKATFRPSFSVLRLALSFDGSRLAAGLSNGTVRLWDSGKTEPITDLGGYYYGSNEDWSDLAFSPIGCRLAFMANSGDIHLWNGEDGKFVANLHHPSWQKRFQFVPSRDSLLLAVLTMDNHLVLWNGQNGEFVGAVGSAGLSLTVSSNGFRLATKWSDKAMFWSMDGKKPLSFVGSLDIGKRQVFSISITQDLLATVSSIRNTVALYDIKNRAYIAELPFPSPETVAISPDCTRLAVGGSNGAVQLWDIPSINTSTLAPRDIPGRHITVLSFSPDCSRLASGFSDGTIELWDTERASKATTRKCHSRGIKSLIFSPEGKEFASFSRTEILQKKDNDTHVVKFWNASDGTSAGSLGLHDKPDAVAFSLELLAVATSSEISIWDRKTRNYICNIGVGHSISLLFSSDGTLLVSSDEPDSTQTSNVKVWDLWARTRKAEFTTAAGLKRLIFSPDSSRLAAQFHDGGFKLFDVVTSKIIEDTRCEDLRWLPTSHWNGFLPSLVEDKDYGWCLLGRFSYHHDRIPLLWIPRELGMGISNPSAYGTKMFALSYSHDLILFIRSNANINI